MHGPNCVFLVFSDILPSGTPVVNALFRQRACIENIFRACVGLGPQNNMLLEYKHSSDVNLRSRNQGVHQMNGLKEDSDVSHIPALNLLCN